MNDILKHIIEVKQTEVSAARQKRPVDEVRSAAEAMAPCRGFYRAVARENPRGINVIAEIKKASPSAGLIRADFDPVKLAQMYQQAGADAISVLTDEQFFQGRLEYIGMVKQAVSLPVLRKEFIIDAYQVYEARAAGADAVLLIAEALDPATLKELMELANSLGMTVLLEVHELESLLRVRRELEVPREPDRLLGVNNRDLKTMTVDVANSIEAIEHCGKQVGIVSESGIKQRADVERLRDAGFSGILIGETLMRADDVGGKFAELFGSSK